MQPVDWCEAQACIDKMKGQFKSLDDPLMTLKRL